MVVGSSPTSGVFFCPKKEQEKRKEKEEKGERDGNLCAKKRRRKEEEQEETQASKKEQMMFLILLSISNRDARRVLQYGIMSMTISSRTVASPTLVMKGASPYDR